MTKTFKELQNIDLVVGQMYASDPLLRDTKFGYAYKRFCQKFYVSMVNELNAELGEVRIDNALEDEKTKAIIRDEKSPRGYAYSKEGEKKVGQEERRVRNEWDTKEIEVEPFISTYIPENLSEEQIDVLTGILI